MNRLQREQEREQEAYQEHQRSQMMYIGNHVRNHIEKQIADLGIDFSKINSYTHVEDFGEYYQIIIEFDNEEELNLVKLSIDIPPEVDLRKHEEPN
jgi:hypothetical protein